MGRNIRLAFLANGKSIHTKRWLKYFINKGYDVHLITFTAEPIEGVKIHESRYFRKFAYPLKIWGVRKAVRKINPDILHAHYILHYGTYAALSGFHPLVLTAWGSDVLIGPKKFYNRAFAKFALKKADLITCDAEHIKGPLLELGAEPLKIKLIHFGTDTQKFRPIERSKKIREQLCIFDSPAVISLRSLEPLYSVETLVLSIPLVLKKIPETKFVIAGKGSQEKKLRDLARSLGVSDSIRFAGLIPSEKLPQYLGSMDVYVSASLSDAGLAASTAEAMACGLAVVITDFGDNRKWVEDGVNGFVIPLKDPNSLAEKIVYLMKNEDVITRFGKISRKIIKERNDYFKEMEKMEGIYKELIERV